MRASRLMTMEFKALNRNEKNREMKLRTQFIVVIVKIVSVGLV